MCVSQHPLPQMGNPLNLCEILDVHVLLTQCHVDIFPSYPIVKGFAYLHIYASSKYISVGMLNQCH